MECSFQENLLCAFADENKGTTLDVLLRKISKFRDEKTKKDSILGLNNAQGYVRREIANRLNIRNTPQFKFVLDNSVEYGIHINELISKLNSEGDKNEF